MGNHNRGLDEITEKEIAKKLADNDISYCAIQLIGQSQDEEHRDAQNLFCMQTRTIIKYTAESMLDIVRQNKDINIFPKDNILQLESLMKSTNNIDCSQVDGVCSSIGDRRWLLRCIRSNEKGVYQKTISNQINQLASDIFDAKSILDDIRQGKTVESTITESDLTSDNDEVNAIYRSEKNVSSKPFLMPGVVNSLIVEIGKDLLSKKDQPAIKSKILKYIGPKRLKKSMIQKHKKKSFEPSAEKSWKPILKMKSTFYTII
ncbi:MAG: hypothetical protein OMM_13411, partial [Candidatus Magnetoglobus multicellularis str. Araruama]